MQQLHTRSNTSRHARTAILVITLAMSGCASSIWNAGDLVHWVKDQAVEEGCQRDTISLEEWYTQTDEGNVWRGTCKGADGKKRNFGINVDSVWKPSQSE
jgi:hypothetical protein